MKDRVSLGLDIGSQTVKIIRLKFHKDAAELADVFIEPNSANLTEFLKSIRHAMPVSVSVSGPSTVIRYVNFPKMNHNELRQALKFEAQKHIPFSVAETNLDGFILKDLPDNKMLVLIAAVKKELINQRLKLLEEAGLKANLVDIDSLALINAFDFNYPKDEFEHKAVALVNMGASVSSLDILEDTSPRLSRDIQIAGNNFTQKIADVLSMDFKSAENLKTSPDKEKAQKVASVIDAVLSNLAGEIRTSLDYYESQSTFTVGKIFLCGGSSSFDALNEKLSNLVGVEVENWDPLKKINIPENLNPQKVKLLSNQLAVAVGLALR